MRVLRDMAPPWAASRALLIVSIALREPTLDISNETWDRVLLGGDVDAEATLLRGLGGDGADARHTRLREQLRCARLERIAEVLDRRRGREGHDVDLAAFEQCGEALEKRPRRRARLVNRHHVHGAARLTKSVGHDVSRDLRSGDEDARSIRTDGSGEVGR